MALDRSTQPIVRDASSTLVGVAQIRVGQPSIRAAVASATIGTTLTPVGKSDMPASTAYPGEYVVRPATIYAPNAGTASAITVALDPTDGYVGNYDGCVIIRSNGATFEVFAPNNYRVTGVSSFSAYNVKLSSTVYSGILITATFNSAVAGDTWVLPVWSKLAQDKPQTGIITPYSMFVGSTYSVGGLKSAEVGMKINGVKRLETGFPTVIADQIIDSTSVSVSFEAYEYANSNMNVLKQMMNEIINKGNIAAISVEAVMRTRGGSLVTYWVPTATFTALPTLAPGNDYNTVKFELEALKQTEVTSETSHYNAALAESYIFSELQYLH